MFEEIFKTDAKVALHVGAPYASERARYLSECVQRGYKLHTVHIKANELLWIAHRLKRANVALRLTKAQIKFALRDGNRRGRNRRCRSGTPPGGRSMVGLACAWLRFLGFLQPALIPFHQKLNAYCRWAREERGFSEQTITTNHGCIKGFLSWYSRRRRPLSAVRINDIDVYLALGAKRGGWSRHYVYNVAKALRAFFRYGGEQGWAPARLAALIRGPRLYTFETLPLGPSWVDVRRLLTALRAKHPTDIRDRAILMLLAFYGLRSGEVAMLRLDDIDWEHDLLHVQRAKVHPHQVYPLLASVGNAILEYLQTVRPTSTEQSIFLTLKFPHKPLSRGVIYHVVAARLAALQIDIPHRGPHSLRHACATHLLAEGLSLKEIGDHLAHRRALTTRVYAKVDLPGLRKVAAFDMGDLS